MLVLRKVFLSLEKVLFLCLSYNVGQIQKFNSHIEDKRYWQNCSYLCTGQPFYW